MVRMSAEGTNPDGGRLLPGKYHVAVKDAGVEPDGRVKIELQVLAGTVPAMVTKTQTEYFALTPKAMNRAFKVAWALGYLTKDQWRQASESKAEVDLPIEASHGRQMIVAVTLRPYNGDDPKHKGKEFPNIGFDMWPVLDPDVADVPKSAEGLAMMGIVLQPAPGGGAPPMSQPPAAPPQHHQPQAPAGGGGGWDKL